MQNTFGTFLKQKRREKNLTKKQLANLLFVTESAVSKWEKDVSHPDIMLLPKLAEILSVTEHELITASIDNDTRKEKIEAKKWRVFSKSWDLSFYIAYGIALLTCFICNLAINKTLSWFFIVFSSILLAFTFTNLPKHIKKYRLLLIPLSMYLALCLLLGICAIYTNGSWFLIPTLSTLLCLTIIFMPIYIAKYKIFEKIKKFNDFISVLIAFILLNVLLIVIDIYSVNNGFTFNHWYIKFALPITSIVYLILNLFLSIRFLKVNKLLKTSIIFALSIFILYVTPLFIKVKNPSIQKELNEINIFRANLSVWEANMTIENNVHLIICLTLLALFFTFFIIGLIKQLKNKNS